MTITVTGIDFDYHDYDERSDVLFLHVGSPKKPPVKSFETPEGHNRRIRRAWGRHRVGAYGRTQSRRGRACPMAHMAAS